MRSLEQNSPAASDRSQPAVKPYHFQWFDWFCLWYPPGWLVLFNRHWHHYHPQTEGWKWFEYGLFLLPGGFYLALLIRWLRLGCRFPQASTHQINPDYQRAFRDEILGVILKRYFRAQLQGLENVPTTGPVMIILNHAGMCFPWDFLGLGTLLSQRQGWFLEPVAHTLFFDHPWLRWWLPPGWTEVLGGVRAERPDFEQAIAHLLPQTALLYAPESWRGLAKGWHQRQQLQTFDPSFIQLSDRYQIPILPVVCRGNERLHPFAWNIKGLARWSGLPIFPISFLMPIFALFPSMGVWAMPARLRYHILPLYCPWKESPKTEVHSIRAIAYAKAQALRAEMQKVLEENF